MVKFVPLFKVVVWTRRVRSESIGTVREVQGPEEGNIFEFRCLPRVRGRGGLWESDQVLCCLCKGFLGWARVGHGDGHIIRDGSPICGGDKGFNDGVIIVYGRKKGLKSMRF